MGLAQTYAAVNEKRIVGSAGMISHLQCCCACQLIRLAGKVIILVKGRVETAGVPWLFPLVGRGFSRRTRERDSIVFYS